MFERRAAERRELRKVPDWFSSDDRHRLRISGGFNHLSSWFPNQVLDQPGRHPILITDRAEVQAVAAVLNELPVEGKGVCSQGFIVGPSRISFVFQRSRNSPGLATARDAAHQNFGLAWCVPTLFSISGHTTLRLEGGSYLLNRAAKILHRNLSPA